MGAVPVEGTESGFSALRQEVLGHGSHPTPFSHWRAGLCVKLCLLSFSSSSSPFYPESARTNCHLGIIFASREARLVCSYDSHELSGPGSESQPLRSFEPLLCAFYLVCPFEIGVGSISTLISYDN